MSGINSYEASINNEWVLFEYDNKNKMIISKKKDSNKPFKGKFVFETNRGMNPRKTMINNKNYILNVINKINNHKNEFFKK